MSIAAEVRPLEVSHEPLLAAIAKPATRVAQRGLSLFEEGKEAEFFASFEELLGKCRYYLAHDLERRKIAAAGYRRCHAGYTNAQRLSAMLEHVLGIPLPATAPATRSSSSSRTDAAPAGRNRPMSGRPSAD